MSVVWECLINLEQLATKNHVTLWWVPRHTGIESNEQADLLAKKAAKSTPIGPEFFIGLTRNHYKRHIREWEEYRKTLYWKNIPAQQHAKKFITFQCSTSSKRAKLALFLERKDLALYTGLLTGHCSLRYCLHRIGKEENGACSLHALCNEDYKTVEHVICHCVAIENIRTSHLGEPVLEPEDLAEVHPKQILRFVRSLDLL